MVFFPVAVFRHILSYNDYSFIRTHNEKIKRLVVDIDLFRDVYSTILADKIDNDVNGWGIEMNADIYFENRKTDFKPLRNFIEDHEYNTELFDYDFDRIDKIYKEQLLISYYYDINTDKLIRKY
jgi:hypothetical protein